MQLDKEPYEVQVALKKATVETATADLEAARDQMRAVVAQPGATGSSSRTRSSWSTIRWSC